MPNGSDVHLEATAYWTAAVRALETGRADRLFDDPWAAALAGPEGEAWIGSQSAQSVSPIAIRTRFFDDALRRVAGDACLTQAVLVAAGLDTRAFRLAWPPGTTVFEVDRPAVLHHKATVLGQAGARPRCTRVAVATDLAGSWEEDLTAAGFVPAEPSLWLVEGLSFYLPAPRLETLLDRITSLAAPGSWLGLDVVNSFVLEHPATRGWVEMQAEAGAPWVGTIDDPVGFLAARRWDAELTQAGQPDADYGRWSLPVLPTTMPGVPHHWFVTARRRA